MSTIHLQTRPSPLVPLLHVHVYEPIVFAHVAFTSHKLDPSLHSSTSNNNNNNNKKMSDDISCSILMSFDV